MPPIWQAISVKQPWATLIIAGIKTIEIRTWRTSHRGPLLIHTGRIPDPRPEGWSLLNSPTLVELAQLQGGIIGIVDLIDTIQYTDAAAFTSEQTQHRNLPDWFRPPHMFGFQLANPKPLSMVPFKGNTSIFSVQVPINPPEAA